MPEVVLAGCQPEPLASYLKALGILRLLSDQKDPEVRGHWRSDGFVLTSNFAIDDLCAFFLDEYQPTPVLSPWNGGSGFGMKDNRDGIDAIRQSTDSRLEPYRRAIAACDVVVQGPPRDKRDLLQALRNSVPDDLLSWLDAAAVLGTDGARFPVLLGTGGNDGRMDFSNNFMQRLCDVLPIGRMKKGSEVRRRAWLDAALLNESAPMIDAAIGQFDPGGAGGSNSAPFGKGKSLVNPWDFVLMIEGALVFTGASVRRIGEERSAIAVPFSFDSTHAGHTTAANESGRGEIWAPLWEQPARYRVVSALFGEGRIVWNNRPARTALDGVRSLASLQLDRAISSFVRFEITERFGLANVAVPVGRLAVPRDASRSIELLGELDGWVNRVRRASAKGPESVARRVRAVEAAQFALATGPRDSTGLGLVAVLHAVDDLERSCARSVGVRNGVRPVSGLIASAWCDHLREAMQTPEMRLAWCFASLHDRFDPAQPRQRRSLRHWLAAVRPERHAESWTDGAVVNGVETRPIEEVLADVAIARTYGDQPDGSIRSSFELGWLPSTDDVLEFVSGSLDGDALRRYLRAFLVLDHRSSAGPQPRDTKRVPDALSAAVLAHAGAGLERGRPSKQAAFPFPSALPRLLSAGTNGAIALLEQSLRTHAAEQREPAGTDERGGSLCRPMLPREVGHGQFLAASLLLDLSGERARLLRSCTYLDGDADGVHRR